MVFEDKWIAVTPSCLIDPLLKLYLFPASFGPETQPNEADIWCAYDPMLMRDRLLVPRTQAEIERAQSYSSRPINPNALTIFQSDKYDFIFQNIYIRWELHGGVLRIKIKKYDKDFDLTFKLMKTKKYPNVSDHPKAIMLHALQSIVKWNMLRTGKKINEEFPDARRLEVCLPTDQAFEFFGLRRSDCPEVELGWVAIASREISQ
jgi:hypothetical protein